MSPRLTPLQTILYAAADPTEPDSEALTLARLRAKGYTPDRAALRDAVAALRDLTALSDGALDPRIVCPDIPAGTSVAVDRMAEAVRRVEAAVDDAALILSRRPEAVAV